MVPPQMQDGDQTVETTAPENAIVDNITDLNDIDQMTNHKTMKDIRDELCKDTPQKTETNKPYIDDIDA